MNSEDIPLNCAIIDDDELSRSMITHLLSKMDGINVMHVCSSAMEGYNLLQTDEEIDLLFLDIEMPEMTGLELIKLLEKRKLNVVLTTSQEQYALEAFEYDVVDYLVKPVNQARLLKAVEKARGRIDNLFEGQSTELPYLFVRSNHKIVKIAPTEITHIEALSDYILIYTYKQKNIVHSTMKSIEDKLSIYKSFVRIHRSYIVNMQHVDTVQDLNVSIKEKQIPIGRSYRAKFIEALDIL